MGGWPYYVRIVTGTSRKPTKEDLNALLRDVKAKRTVENLRKEQIRRRTEFSRMKKD